MSTTPLSIDVYVAPMRPYTYPGQLGEGEVATWAPSSSTLISGPTEGILIDALLTFENADKIAAWAKTFGKKITGVYITHGHSDHWLGLARLLQHFPKARGCAAPEVAARAAWEAEFNKRSKYWTSRFPGELPETPAVPEVLNIDEILTWSTACSSCMASATSRTPCGSRPEPKSLDGHEPLVKGYASPDLPPRPPSCALARPNAEPLR